MPDECRNHVVRLAWKKAETVRTLFTEDVNQHKEYSSTRAKFNLPCWYFDQLWGAAQTRKLVRNTVFFAVFLICFFFNFKLFSSIIIEN